jgi:outer membrane protein TolC
MTSINLPIWRNKYDAGVRQAKYRYHSALQKRQEQENNLEAQLKYAWYHFRDAQRKINLYADALVPKAEQSLQVAESAFQAGQGSFTDLIDAQRILLEFQLVYERALSNHEQSLAKLEMLVGREIPKTGNETGP